MKLRGAVQLRVFLKELICLLRADEVHHILLYCPFVKKVEQGRFNQRTTGFQVLLHFLFLFISSGAARLAAAKRSADRPRRTESMHACVYVTECINWRQRRSRRFVRPLLKTR